MHDAEYTDSTGAAQKYYMGCYGIGIGRTMAAVVEAHHDDKGIIWPASIAPFAVHLLRLGNDNEAIAQADALYDELQQAGIEVLYDDTNKRPGEKFADADLLGLPHRIVVSAKTVAAGQLEYKSRENTVSELIATAELKKRLT